jgi:triosephosphate isomerase
MERRKIFAGNWKMYNTKAQAETLTQGILDGIKTVPDGREIIIFPPFTLVDRVSSLCAGSAVSTGAQNMYFEDEGAFTGEISPVMIKDAGCRYVLLGHSERRHVLGETDAEINKKVLSALKHGIEPVLCVGELLEERESEKTADVIGRQLKEGLAGVTENDFGKIIIAYEPVWAIGTGKVATPDMAGSVHAIIRSFISNIFGQKTADSLPILYGGSVKPDNIAGLYAIEGIDGALIGGASLKADSFLAIASVR